MDSIREFKNAFQNWSFATIAIITVGVKGKGNSKGKR
jgi:hypothetical protein